MGRDSQRRLQVVASGSRGIMTNDMSLSIIRRRAGAVTGTCSVFFALLFVAATSPSFFGGMAAAAPAPYADQPAINVPLTNEYDYALSRKKLVKQGSDLRFDAGVVLSEDEIIVDRYFKALKKEEFAKRRTKFPPAHYFPTEEADYENSTLFQIFKELPKGGNLHVHSFIGGLPTILQAFYKHPNLYVMANDTTHGVG